MYNQNVHKKPECTQQQQSSTDSLSSRRKWAMAIMNSTYIYYISASLTLGPGNASGRRHWRCSWDRRHCSPRAVTSGIPATPIQLRPGSPGGAVYHSRVVMEGREGGRGIGTQKRAWYIHNSMIIILNIFYHMRDVTKKHIIVSLYFT